MSVLKGGGPAFARPAAWQSPTNMSKSQEGMSLRAYIATEVMHAIIATPGSWGSLDYHPTITMSIMEHNAECAVRVADALIAALEKESA